MWNFFLDCICWPSFASFLVGLLYEIRIPFLNYIWYFQAWLPITYQIMFKGTIQFIFILLFPFFIVPFVLVSPLFYFINFLLYSFFNKFFLSSVSFSLYPFWGIFCHFLSCLYFCWSLCVPGGELLLLRLPTSWYKYPSLFVYYSFSLLLTSIKFIHVNCYPFCLLLCSISIQFIL